MKSYVFCVPDTKPGFVDDVRRDLVSVCGGVTEWAGRGVWTAPCGRVDAEPVVLFMVWTTEDPVQCVMTRAYQYNEEAVGYTVNGVPHIDKV